MSKSALFCDLRQHRVVIPYRRFGQTNGLLFTVQVVQEVFLNYLTLEQFTSRGGAWNHSKFIVTNPVIKFSWILWNLKNVHRICKNSPLAPTLRAVQYLVTHNYFYGDKYAVLRHFSKLVYQILPGVPDRSFNIHISSVASLYLPQS